MLCGEPYILYNFYHGEKTGYRYDTPGQNWYNRYHSMGGKSLICFVFGLKPTMEGLTLDPCPPKSWRECAVTKAFRDYTYEILYRQERFDGAWRILVNGEPINGNLLPYEVGASYRVKVIG